MKVAVTRSRVARGDPELASASPGASPALLQAIVQAAQTQFWPVLMLILVAMLGMVPAAIARGIGSDIQRPLATVVVGGLLSTFFLTLLALPAVYAVAERFRKS